MQPDHHLTVSVKAAGVVGPGTASVGYMGWLLDHQSELAVIGICFGILASIFAIGGVVFNVWRNWPKGR